MWNQLEYRGARRIRLRGDAVQLHLDRGEPADRARADGQHRDLEAGLERDVLGLLPDEAARGGRHAARRHQLRRRRRGEISERAALAPRPRRRALHRQHRGLQQHVEDDRRLDVDGYRSYPRIVGETGGKDFIVAHPSADVEALAVAIVRGGFEFQGQKCSAASRVYIPQIDLGRRPRSRGGDDRRDQDGRRPGLPQLHGRGHRQARLRQDQRATSSTPARTRRSSPAARATPASGYFIRPTLIETADPGYRLLCEEIFGPVVTAYVYDDAKWEETLKLVDSTSPYALTGAVFAQDRRAIVEATSALRNAAGNFYVNDKPTGAVVGQQPFGGARASGTNDKAGSKLNLVRWVSARTMKENFTRRGTIGIRSWRNSSSPPILF